MPPLHGMEVNVKRFSLPKIRVRTCECS